jgi:hypothetical protein
MRSIESVSIPEYGLWLRLLEEYCIVEQVSHFDVAPRLPVPRYFLNALTICGPKKSSSRQVLQNSAAEKSGLELGDIIEKIDGCPVRTCKRN